MQNYDKTSIPTAHVPASSSSKHKTGGHTYENGKTTLLLQTITEWVGGVKNKREDVRGNRMNSRHNNTIGGLRNL